LDALAIICDDPGRGGCASVARMLWRRLDVGRPRVLVTDLAGAPPGLFSEDEVAGLPDRRIFPFPIDEKRSDSATFDIRRALDALERIAPAQIMFHDSRALESMLALKRAARHLAVPFAATQHLVLPDFDGRVAHARAGDLRWARAARHLVFVSADNRDRFTERLPHCADKATLIRNGVDPGPARWPDSGARARLRKAASAGEAEKLVVLVARLDAAKGQDIAIRALARPALPGAPSWRLILIGDDPDGRRGELERLAASLSVSHRLSFLGHRSDVRDLMRGADALLQTGRAEGLPLSLLEAMAEGAPIVARTAGGVTEAVDTGSALLLGAGDDTRVAEAAARALDRLFAEPGLASSLSSTARARFDESYRSDVMMRDYATLTEQLERFSAPQRKRMRLSARCSRTPPFAIDFRRPGEAWNVLGRGWGAQ
jgi:glycosyltransferase involved in cell wall biosynthesis